MMKGNATDPKGAIIAKSECNFLRPVTYPDVVTVCCRASRMGNSSLSVEYLLLNDKMEECATGAAVLVMYDYINDTTYRMDDEMRKTITELENAANPPPQ